MVIVPQNMPVLEKMLDYQGVGLQRSHCTKTHLCTYVVLQQPLSVIPHIVCRACRVLSFKFPLLSVFCGNRNETSSPGILSCSPTPKGNLHVSTFMPNGKY